MSTQRSTFSLAQLLLLVMLTGLLCAWLPKSAEWTRHIRSPDSFNSKLSSDGSRLICFNSYLGFSVFDTASGKCLMDREFVTIEPFVIDANLRTVCVQKLTTNRNDPDPLSQTPRRMTVYEVDSRTEREVEAPSDDPCVVRPIGIDENGNCVEMVIPLGVSSYRFSPFVQKWNLKTGKLLHQFTDNRYATYHQILPGGGMLLAGQCRVNIPQAENVEVQGPPGSYPPGSDRVTNEAPSFVEWRLNTNKVRRTIIADKGTTLWRLLCVNEQGDKALFFMREPYDGEHRPVRRSLILADGKSGTIQHLGALGLSYIEKGAWSADERFLVGIGNVSDSTNAVLFRSELSGRRNRILAEMENSADSYVSDLKLVEQDQKIALATSSGLFRIFDAKTGEELRKVQCVRPSSRLSILYVFVVTAVTWLILWFWATRRKQGQGFDFGKYLVLAVFGVGLSSGLLLLALHDPYSQSNRWLLPLLFAATTTGAIFSLICLFARRCNFLAAGYSLFAFAAMGLHVVWLTFHSLR